MTIEQKHSEILADFQNLPNWEDRYKKIIQLGRSLPDMPEELKTDDLKVKGCQSQVWLHADLDADGHVVFQADSDALIVKGLLALLLKYYSNEPPKEILEAQPEFVGEIGLQNHLSPSRANGLHAMIKQIKYYATAFQAIQATKSLS